MGNRIADALIEAGGWPEASPVGQLPQKLFLPASLSRLSIDSSPRFQSVNWLHPFSILVMQHTFGCGESLAQISLL
jgi:hypothetical protein